MTTKEQSQVGGESPLPRVVIKRTGIYWQVYLGKDKVYRPTNKGQAMKIRRALIASGKGRE